MKKLSALVLPLLLLLTACGTPAVPDDGTVLPTSSGEILVEEGPRTKDLPEARCLWVNVAETSGAADKSSKIPLASRAGEGACDYLAIRMPDGSYTDLIQEGKIADKGVSLADFSGGGAKQDGSYGQLAWNGELYHAFTISAVDCAIPNFFAPDGGILRLNRGAGVFSAQNFSGAEVNDYGTGAVLWDGVDNSAYRESARGGGYYPTIYSADWAGAASCAEWDALTVTNPYESNWFAGTLMLEGSHATELLPWGERICVCVAKTRSMVHSAARA